VKILKPIATSVSDLTAVFVGNSRLIVPGYRRCYRKVCDIVIKLMSGIFYCSCPSLHVSTDVSEGTYAFLNHTGC